MKPADRLASFVAEALAAGHARSDISAELKAAGWADSEVAEALETWADTRFRPPVPRPRAYVSAREAFVYALTFLALAVSAWHITALGFQLIDLWIPDIADSGGAYAARSVRWSISVLVVAFPLFLALTTQVNRAARRDPSTRRSAVRKWFGYVTLFLAAVALLGDLVAVIYALLNGDLTSRFAAKAVLVAVTAGLVLLHFRGQLKEVPDAR